MNAAYQVRYGAARQMFERGFMLWFDHDGGTIFVIAEDGWWNDYVDTWDGKSETIAYSPPSGKIKPSHGFGHVWSRSIEVKRRLGWATHAEEPGQGECDDMGEDGWYVTFGDDYSATLEYPIVPEPEPAPEPEPLPFLTADWVWLPTLNMPLNLAFIAFVNEKGRCQFGKYDMMLALPDTDTEFVREELRRRCKPSLN